MTPELRVTAAFAAAALLTWMLTPLARRLAVRTRFLDRPTGYKQHLRVTPYLGGLAVVGGFCATVAVFGGPISNFGWLMLCVVALMAVGTIDDRIGLGIGSRLVVETFAAVLLWAVGQGWTALPDDGLNLVLTIAWVVGLINAFNLMDNLDGAAASVAAVCGAGAGALALIDGTYPLAAMCFALSGACAGFLPHNLAKPSRIFLGDGGSMPIGLVVAAMIMAIPSEGLSWAAVLASAPLVALPIFDVSLVIVSRHRRGAPLLEGGRDHVTHRLLARLPSERYVALSLAAAQALMCGVALFLHQTAHPLRVLAGVLISALVGAIFLVLLETRPWAQPLPVQRSG